MSRFVYNSALYLSLIIAVKDGFQASPLAPAIHMKERQATVEIVGKSWTCFFVILACLCITCLVEG